MLYTTFQIVFAEQILLHIKTYAFRFFDANTNRVLLRHPEACNVQAFARRREKLKHAQTLEIFKSITAAKYWLLEAASSQ